MKVLITGGNGFLGKAVAAELASRGHFPVVFDRHREELPTLAVFRESAISRMQLDELQDALRALGETGKVITLPPAQKVPEMILGDVLDATAVNEAVAHADAVIHLAGVLGTSETILNPRPAVETNILGGLNVLEACAQYRTPLVNIAVGNHFEFSTYSISKNTVERFTTMYARYRDLPACSVRCFNVYGPGQSVAQPYGCVAPDTPVLCSNLTWQPISDLRAGDEIIGIDEYSLDGLRKLRRVTVTGSWAVRKQAVRLRFDDGRSIVCSLDHPWLATSPAGQLRQWTETRKLRVGHRIVWPISRVWSTRDDRSHGYIAGLLDGEGHVAPHRVVFTQNPGSVLDEYLRVLKECDFDFRSRPKENGRSVIDVHVWGMTQVLRLLGEFQPVRLLPKAAGLWDGVAPKGGRASITEIEELGEEDLWDIETTSHTYIANGFASHNSSRVRKIIPSFIARALHGETIQVYGDGSQVMDMIYITDAAKCLVTALEKIVYPPFNFGTAERTPPPEGGHGEVYQAGTGRKTTVRQIAREVQLQVQLQTGIFAEIEYLPMRPGETPGMEVLADEDEVRRLLEPNDFVQLENGLRETVTYYRELFAK